MKKIIRSVMLMVLALVMVMPLASCSAPELSEVKDTFVSLIEQSAEVNQILFGRGLATYGDISYDEDSKTYYVIYHTKEEGKLCAYLDKETNNYVVLRYGEKGEGEAVYSDDERRIYLYKTDLEFEDAAYGSRLYDEESETYYVKYRTQKDGKLCAYLDKETKAYIVLRYGEKDEGEAVYADEEKGIYLYKTDLPFTFNLPEPPADYKLVRFDERFSSVSQIADMAAKVYSEDYLADVFESVMGGLDDGDIVDVGDMTAVPKYKEMIHTEIGDDGKKTEKKYLVRADLDLCPPLMDFERIYDFDTMTVAKGSRASFVKVEINSYGPYIDLSGDIPQSKIGWHTVELSFVKQNGEWRLDSPTY